MPKGFTMKYIQMQSIKNAQEHKSDTTFSNQMINQ
jgi:hypothetical protein